MSNKKGLIEYLLSEGKKENESWDTVALAFGYNNGETARVAWKDYRKKLKIIDDKPSGKISETKEFKEDIKNGTAELTAKINREIKTLDELIKYCNIDINIWTIDKYVQNYWGNLQTPHWQVKAWLSRKKIDESLDKQKDLLILEMKKHSPTSATFYPKKSKDGRLLEISLPDLHLGKLAWTEESGEDYDCKIAVTRFKNAIKDLLIDVDLSRIERIHFPLGNDFIHIDTEELTTTAGTHVDSDSRFPKIIGIAKALLIETVDELKSIAPIDITIVRGNHDYTTMFMLGEVLEAWYHNDNVVRVYNGPKSRKYYQYGKCGFQYTHGDCEKHDELGLLFAVEEKKMWCETDHRFCKLGHTHKNKKTKYLDKDTLIGFQIEVLPSLSGTDEWHYKKGYVGAKQAKAFLYDKIKGEVMAITHTVVI